MQPKPTALDHCAVEACEVSGFALEYHHVAPTCEEMVKKALDLVSRDELETLFGYDKFAEGKHCVADFILDDHAVLECLRELHKDNEWLWLCSFHHRG
jgi:hypothetical protein